MAGYTLTFDPANGSTVTLAEGAGLSSFTISCEDGIALSDDETVHTLYDSENGVRLEFSFEATDANTITCTLVEEDGPITAAGTYKVMYRSGRTWGDGFIEGKFLLGEEQTPSEVIEYYFTVVIFDGLILPLTDLDGNVTGSAYVTPVGGSGDGAVSVTADEDNEGLDRSGVVTFHTTKGEPAVSVARSIVQLGLREPFAGSDGDFIVADGGTFHVLK